MEISNFLKSIINITDRANRINFNTFNPQTILYLKGEEMYGKKI